MLIFDLIKALIALVKLWGRSPNMVVALGALIVVPIAIFVVLIGINEMIYNLYFVQFVLPKLTLFASQDPFDFYKAYMIRKIDEPEEILIAYLVLEVIYQLIKLPKRILFRKKAQA